MNWLIILSWWAQGVLQGIQRHHLKTDPACVHYTAPRVGSVLDRASRGLECEPCMVHRAFYSDDDVPWQGCTVPPDGWWCSREAGHEPPCAARPGKHPGRAADREPGHDPRCISLTNSEFNDCCDCRTWQAIDAHQSSERQE